MNSDKRSMILDVARGTVQAHGYGGLSFRDLAAAVGIRSASVHYHFPTKADLGVELARRYTEQAAADLAEIAGETADRGDRLRRYAGLFRRALENGNRMCLCGILAAESDELPEPVLAEVRSFAEVNLAWLAHVLGGDDPAGCEDRARAIFAAVNGAQLVARGRCDVALFDRILETYRVTGLIPG